jgi:hypothetical protein
MSEALSAFSVPNRKCIRKKETIFFIDRDKGEEDEAMKKRRKEKAEEEGEEAGISMMKILSF